MQRIKIKEKITREQKEKAEKNDTQITDKQGKKSKGFHNDASIFENPSFLFSVNQIK